MEETTMQATCGQKPFGLSINKPECFSAAVSDRASFDPVEVRLARGLALQVFLTGLVVSGLMVLGIHGLGLY